MRQSTQDIDETDLPLLKEVLERFYLRIVLCPCLNQSCDQCCLDIESINDLEEKLDYGPIFDRSQI